MLSKNRHKHITNWKEKIFNDFSPQEKDRFFLLIPVLLAIGIAVYFGMTTEFPVWVGLTCLFISGVTTYYYRNYYIVFLSTLSLTIVFVGFSSAQLRTYYLDTNILPKSFGPAGIQGRIVDIQPTSKGTRLTLEDLQIARLRADYVPTRLRLHVNSLKPQVKTGQWVKARAMLKPPPAPNAPGAFDFQRYAYFQKIGAIGFSYGDVQILGQNENPHSNFFADLRQSIQKQIEQILVKPDQKAVQALAIALLTGNKRVIDETVHESVRAAGLAHLLAISGLHIGLVSALVFFTVRFILAYIPYIALRYPIKKWAGVAALLAALFFTLLTGASIPTIRAFLMCGVVLVGILLDRKAISLHTVAWAAIVILLIFPESLLGASFQLSFAAVTALIAYYERHKTSYEHSASRRYIEGIFTSSLIATVATTPFAAYHFNRIALYGIGANMLAIPLTVFWIMPLGITSLLLMPFGFAEIALIPMGWGISALLWVAEYTAAIPYAQLSIPAMGDWALIAITVGGLSLCLMQHFTAKTFGLTAISLGLFLTFTTSQPDILISGNGKLSAIQMEKGEIALSNIRHAAYIRDNWLRRWGEENHTPALLSDKIPCDITGCRYIHQSGQQVVLNKSAMSLNEDCQKADILITTIMSPTVCESAKHLIDQHSLKTQGAHAVYFNAHDTRVVTLKDIRGQRPWTVYGE